MTATLRVHFMDDREPVDMTFKSVKRAAKSARYISKHGMLSSFGDVLEFVTVTQIKCVEVHGDESECEAYFNDREAL